MTERSERAFWHGHTQPSMPFDGGLPDAPEAYGDGLDHVPRRGPGREGIFYNATPASAVRSRRAMTAAIAIVLVLLGMVLGTLPQFAGRAHGDRHQLCVIAEGRR